MLFMWLHCIKFICMLLPVFMAVARTADTVGAIGEDCQTAVRLYGPQKITGEGRKVNFI